MPAKVNHQWRLVARPVGAVKASDFEWTEQPLPEVPEGRFLVRNLYLSLDPANRAWLNERDTYVPAVGLGEVMRGMSIGVVEESKHPNFKPGDIVQGVFGWQEYALSEGTMVTPLRRVPGFPLTVYHGVLGIIGLTAYFGLLDICDPKPGETLVVSAAAGAVGSIVGQIGKIKGCRVVGIAGGAEKCKWITESLGFDAAIDYKSENVYESLKKHCPDGIDTYFENVGGKMLDAVLALINKNARISICGLISQYNATEPVPGPYNFANILTKSAKVEGFIVLDYLDRAEPALAEMAQWLMAGKLKYRIDVVDGLEQAPIALNMLFDGTNNGKLIVKISEEPA